MCDEGRTVYGRLDHVNSMLISVVVRETRPRSDTIIRHPHRYLHPQLQIMLHSLYLRSGTFQFCCFSIKSKFGTLVTVLLSSFANQVYLFFSFFFPLSVVRNVIFPFLIECVIGTNIIFLFKMPVKMIMSTCKNSDSEAHL